MTNQAKLTRLAQRVCRLERIVALLRAINAVRYESELARLREELKAEMETK